MVSRNALHIFHTMTNQKNKIKQNEVSIFQQMLSAFAQRVFLTSVAMAPSLVLACYKHNNKFFQLL